MSKRIWVFEGKCGFSAAWQDDETYETVHDATRGDDFYHQIAHVPMKGGVEYIEAAEHEREIAEKNAKIVSLEYQLERAEEYSDCTMCEACRIQRFRDS